MRLGRRGRDRASRELLLRALEADPTVGAEAASLHPALAARLAAGVRARIAPPALPWGAALPGARRAAPALRAGAFASCALLGSWVGWGVERAAPASPTLLAAVQLTPFADPAP